MRRLNQISRAFILFRFIATLFARASLGHILLTSSTTYSRKVARIVQQRQISRNSSILLAGSRCRRRRHSRLGYVPIALTDGHISENIWRRQKGIIAVWENGWIHNGSEWPLVISSSYVQIWHRIPTDFLRNCVSVRKRCYQQARGVIRGWVYPKGTSWTPFLRYEFDQRYFHRSQKDLRHGWR